MRKFFTVLAALATLSLTNCGYNAIQSQDEQIKSDWSEVVNQYQRRADLVPNLVNSVKGFAQQEKDVSEVMTTIDRRLRDLDRMGIDVQVVAPAPGQCYYTVDAKIGEDTQHVRSLGAVVRVGHVAHVQDQVRFQHLLQGRAEGGHQMGGKV